MEAVYCENKRALLAVALNITRCQSLAEDAIQNAFEKIVRTMRQDDYAVRETHESQFKPTSASNQLQNLKAYLFQSVRNAAIDIQRGDKRIPESNVSFFENELSDSHSPVESAELNEQREKIKSMISGLAESEREIVFLKIYSGFTFERIGEITQTSSNTIASRYRRLLEKMKSALKEKDD